eukprot:scaffold97293_cov17-Tisochrysis_lutea.AAC.3
MQQLKGSTTTLLLLWFSNCTSFVHLRASGQHPRHLLLHALADTVYKTLACTCCARRRKNDSGLSRGSVGGPSGPWDGSNPLILNTHGSVSPEQASRTNSFNFLSLQPGMGGGGGGGVMASKLQ